MATHFQIMRTIPYPADDAAVAAGVTVTVSTGDAGTAHTIGSPATDPNVISAGAINSYRIFVQTVSGGIQLGSGGYVDNNISSFSSAGPGQSGQQTVDVCGARRFWLGALQHERCCVPGLY